LEFHIYFTYVVYVFVFLASIRCNKVVTDFLMAFGANIHLPHYAVLFVSLQFPFLAGPNPLSAALLRHRTITAHKIARIFSWTVKSAFIHEEGKL
jgi:hypothetical protein